MEYLSGGELFDYVLDRCGLSDEKARDIFTQIVKAAQHCHENSVIHRDLKLENILLNQDEQPKLVDFGFSKETHLEEMLATYCGSALYASPEMVLCKPYLGPECDIWSLGVILYTLLTATMPFDDSNFTKFASCLEKGEYPEPPGTTELARDLISRMLDPNSSSRATIQEILAHPWMKMTTTAKRQRKVNVCYSKDNAENITQTLIDHNRCDCSCHDEDVRANRRDSVITKHCPDCDDIIANDPHQHQYLLRTVSTNSSGYGSEFGSQLDLDTPGILLQSNFYNRFMLRRNSTPKQSSSKPPLAHKHRNSIPSTATKVYRDEDLVFV